MSPIALLGASGFVGSRIVEMFHLGGSLPLRPIVRSFGSLARLARFDLDWRLADACDELALAAAFEGCEHVVHSVVGPREVVEQSIVATYRAAERAGVQRLVYLSTASVHGQAPAPGTDEDSDLHERHAQEYNNFKVRAERSLVRERLNGRVGTVILRPGIVFGPRDRWVRTLADELLRGTAYLVEGGAGICNSIYVDNLVQAVHLALTVDQVIDETFLVGDREIITWADFYRLIARSMGRRWEEIHQVSATTVDKSWKDRVGSLRSLNVTQALLRMVPWKAKRAVEAALVSWHEPPAPSAWAIATRPPPAVSPEIAELHRCSYKLPSDKARRLLGYEPSVSFEEGCRRSIEWLRFAGYPILSEAPTNSASVQFMPNASSGVVGVTGAGCPLS